MQTWQQWIYLNKHKMKHPVDFEERFAIEILTKIKEITPNDVIPQYHFIDFDGGNRYIDFCIKNEEKGYFLSIELDGRDKFLNQELTKTLERQNALVVKVGTLVRYANTTWLNNPNRVINEIQTILYSQQTKHMKAINYKKQIEESLASYQEQLDRVLKQSQSNTQDQEIKQLNSVVQSLKKQLEAQKEQPQNDQTNEALKNINLMMLTLMQQMKEIQEKNQISQPPDKEPPIPTPVPEIIQKSSRITNTHMALVGVVVLLVAGISTYVLKEKQPTDTYPEPQLLTQTLESNSSSDLQALKQAETQEPYVELKKVSQESDQNEASHYESVETLAPQSISQNASVVQSNQATRYIGEYKTVCGHVAQIKAFSKGTYLNLGGAYPSQDLTVVVWSSDQYQVGDIQRYANENICVSGEISTYKGTPQIKLSSSDQVSM
ncbi:MAG: hypothetical protein ACN6NK_05930 [Acinetobacter pseudolwoffii]